MTAELVASRQLSYVSGTADLPLLADTVGDYFEMVATRHADRGALIEHATGRRWSYRQLALAVDTLAAGLLQVGIEPGDRVAVWGPNQAEWVITQLAAARMGAILVTIDPNFGSLELRYVLAQSGARMVVCADRFKRKESAAMLDAVRGECPALEHVVVMGGVQWAALMADGRVADPGVLAAAIDGLHAEDPVTIQYTSGTTGSPKGATLSHHNILNNGFFVAELCRYTESDRVCVPVPFFHCFGMVMGTLAALSHGACIVIPSAVFSAGTVLEAVSVYRCTSLYGVPTMFIGELSDPDFEAYDLSSLRTGIMSGSPCPVEVMNQVVQRMGMTEVTICYGMTETSPVATQTRIHDDIERRVGTVGTAGPHVEIKVIDSATGRTAYRGEPGEVCIRGYSVMMGYWDEPELTAAAIDARGWMHTGDQGSIDAAGYLAITGRIKDMVIRGGENLYPREIEEFLHTHPDILDVQVFGVPDLRYGEELMAWVRLRPGVDTLTHSDLREFGAGRLAHHKIPRHVYVVDEFPMTASGKPRKVEMREIGTRLLQRSAHERGA